jgi:hypothetical protein
LALRLGTSPTDEQAGEIVEDRKAAELEIVQAADSETGLFDLPLRQDTNASGIVKGGASGTSQASPYAWMRDQRTRGRTEDSRG